VTEEEEKKKKEEVTITRRPLIPILLKYYERLKKTFPILSNFSSNNE